MLKLLLNIDEFQPRLLKLLLEKLGEISSAQSGREAQETNVPRLILTAMRWLDKLVDGAGMVEKMEEILVVTTDYHRREVIMSMPEILPPSQHNSIATYLHGMLDTAPTLTACIVDCLGNLRLSPGMKSTTQRALLKRLANFEFSSLPPVVDFLLSECTKETAQEIVSDFRLQLQLKPRFTVLSQGLSQADRRKKEKENRTVERSILDKIDISILCDSFMADAWLKAIDSVNEAEEMKPLDLLLIVKMYKIKPRRKALENLLKGKIRKGVLTESLIIATFEQHSSLLAQSPVLGDLLSIASILINQDKSVSDGPGKQIYISGFNTMEYCRVEIVSELTTEVFRSYSALSVLTHLSVHQTEELSVYNFCLTPLLSQLSDQADLAQVRLLLSLLARLVWRHSGSVNQAEDEVVIFVKKQLYSGISFYRRIGVVGVVVCAQAMIAAAKKDSSSHSFGEPMAESSRNESSSELSGLLLEAEELLEFAEMRTLSDPNLAGLLLDEMATSLTRTETSSMDFNKRISKDLVNKLESQYVKIAKDLDLEEFNIPMSCELDLQEEDKDHVVILAKSVVQASVNAANRNRYTAHAAKMIPTLRLAARSMQLLTTVSQESHPAQPLGDIITLLSCSVLIFSKEVVSKMSTHDQSEKNLVCSTYFYAINWLIELINCFCLEEDGEVRKLVLLRLKQIITLRSTLQQALKSNPSFRPPIALFCEDTSQWSPPSVPGQNKKAAKTGKKTGKGKKTKTVLSASMLSQNSLASQSTYGSQVARIISQSNREVKSRPLELHHYRPFFRELDLAACLAVIGGEPVTTELPPDFDEEKLEPRLRPPELVWLLRDLHLKLENMVRLKVFPGNKNFSQVGFTNLHLQSQREIMEAVMEKLKYLLSHLDQLKDYFVRLVAMSSGPADLAKLITPHTLVIMDCLKSGLQALLSFFSWTGFRAAENEELLRRSFLCIVARLGEVGPYSDLVSLVTESLDYLKSFSVCSLTADIAVVHLTLMATLAGLKEEDAGDAAVLEVATLYIKEDWRDITGEKDKGAEFNVSVGRLLKVFMENSEHIYDDLSSICMDGSSSVIDNNQPSDKFPMINKGSLNTVYKTVLSTLVSEVKKMTGGPTKDQRAQYGQWSQALDIYVTLLTDLQKIQNKAKPLVLWGHALRHSKPFLDHFIKQGKHVNVTIGVYSYYAPKFLPNPIKYPYNAHPHTHLAEYYTTSQLLTILSLQE